MIDKWDKRFLRIALEVSEWSKDPGTRVGAVLVLDRRIIATGYNGFPKGIADTSVRYDDRDTKLMLTVHAELNALLNAAKSGAMTKGSTLYVTFPPCVNCCTAALQSGVERVVCPDIESSPPRWAGNFLLGNAVLLEGGITVDTYDPYDDI